jgi:hypothetical protein
LEVVVRDGGTVRRLTGAVGPETFVQRLRGSKDRGHEGLLVGKGTSRVEWKSVENVLTEEGVEEMEEFSCDGRVIGYNVSVCRKTVTKTISEEYHSLMPDFEIYVEPDEFDLDAFSRTVEEITLDEDKENERPPMECDMEEMDLDAPNEDTQQEDWA